MPSVLNQLGPDTMASLRKIAEQYQAQNAAQGGAALPTGIEDVESGDNGEEIPELVEAAEVRRDFLFFDGFFFLCLRAKLTLFS
jgi:nascent polypeptide-associated complex subunit beta